MTRTPLRGRRPAFALLAALILVFPGVARSEPEDEIQKRIDLLKQKLEALKRAAPPGVPDTVTSKMTWRNIGPANMGGRITALAVVESDPTTYYVATASGGLLKTTNNGTTFSFVFDNKPTVSIGDVAVSQSNPDILYLGTGEANPRNSVSYGDGVYKSTDGGKKWDNVGLNKSFQIGKILIHPTDPNTVYVAALGRLYGPNPERGVFKTTDGGKTWTKSLYVDDKTGAIELAMDPNDPNVLLAGLWERKRDAFDGYFGEGATWPGPDQYGPIVSHGPGGGLFRTTDGGKNWKKLTGEKATTGLPTVKTGRIGLDFSRKAKGLVYAIIDTENIGKGRPTLSVYLGVSGDNALGGARLTAVVEKGPAGLAGLKTGDVVTEADGQKIADYDALLDFMVPKKPDDVVKLSVSRAKAKVEKKDEKKEVKEERETLTVSMKLGAKQVEPAPKKGGGGTPQLLSPGGLLFGVSSLDDPAKISEVPKGGAAEKAGIKPGMVVVGVDGKAVGNYREFRTELRVSPKLDNPRKAGDKVKIAVAEGDKKPFTVELAIEPAESAAGGRRGGLFPDRPFIVVDQLGRQTPVGGQQANVQTSQGKDGFNTGGVYMSKDGGDTWKRVNSVNPRPFYFSQVRTDPTDEKTVYVFGDTILWRSTDGGNTFASARAGTVHPDHHALWINPKNGKHLIIGCDGGFYATYDRGATWDHINTTSLAQFYHVAVDNRKPYRVYGGLQDNGSWGAPSRTLRGTGPANEDWQFLRGGDGFVCRVDPQDPDWVYSESQNGFMGRRNLKTGEERGIRPRPVKENEQLRFNWNTPFILSSHNSHIFYCGAQYVFRSVARGENLKPVSPDLTRTKQGSLTAIAESPKSPETLWAGSDDGYLWLTRDGGANWVNVTENLKKAGLPGHYWVASIEPAQKAEGRCYVCLDAHRSDDDKPYIFMTEDFGATWKSITNNLPSFGSSRVVREDITTSDILYCGTEFGIFVSLNRGDSWAKINNNLPTVAVHEIAQPTTAGEIAIATHGRGIWILDVASLRQMKPATFSDPVTLFAPPPVTRWHYGAGSFPYSVDVRKFYGTNPPPGGSIDYMLTKAAKDVSLKVVDVAGKSVREFKTPPAGAGFHRVQWIPPKAGTFRVVLVVDGKEHSQTVTVENDPNAPVGAIITDAPELIGKNNEPKLPRKEPEVTPIPRSED